MADNTSQQVTNQRHENQQRLQQPDPTYDALFQLNRSLQECEDLLLYVGNVLSDNSDEFHRAMATTTYLRDHMLTQLEVVKKQSATTPNEIRAIQKKVLNCDRELVFLHQCKTLLNHHSNPFQFRWPHLFLVLPANLSQWSDMDSTTHALRLHYLCDVDYSGDAGLPDSSQFRHIHISGHQGYDLLRPKEFLQHYGQHALVVLEMAKRSFTGDTSHIHELDYIDMLACCGDPFHQISENTFLELVDAAIAYIHKTMRRNEDSLISEHVPDTRLVCSFLRTQPGDRGLGDLCRERYGSSARWICQGHATEVNSKAMTDLVLAQEGTVDFTLGMISMPLMSPLRMDQLTRILRHAKRIEDVSIQLKWDPSRNELRSLFDIFAQTGVNVLQLQGATADTQAQNLREDDIDVYVEQISIGRMHIVFLRNYPETGQLYVYFGQKARFVHGVRLNRAVARADLDWQDLMSSLSWYMDGMFRRQPKMSVNAKMKALTDIIAQFQELDPSGLDVFDPMSKAWQGQINFHSGTADGFTRAVIPSRIPQQFLEYGTLIHLSVEADGPNCIRAEQLNRLIHYNPQLETIEVLIQERHLLPQLANLRRHWHGTSPQLEATLIERAKKLKPRMIAQIVMSKAESVGKSNNQTTIQVLSWTCNYVFGPLDDPSAAILDTASHQHPDVLTSFELNISSLSQLGLVSIQHVLERSSLNRLHLACTTFDLKLIENIKRVLRAISNSAIVLLTFSGNNIDSWIQLMVCSNENPFHELNLSRLEIVGTGREQHVFSHASAMFVHKLICSSSLIELHIENIQLKEARDWELVREALDFGVQDYKLVRCNNAQAT